MQLLIQRGQFTNAMNKSRFTLWVKYELTEDERILIRKYDIYNTLLVEGKPGELVKAAIEAIFLTCK